MNSEHLLEINLTVRGPVLVKSSQPAAFGIDAAMARVACGPDAKKACIPGTLLKGKLAEALAQLGRTDVRLEEFNRKWLGVDSDQPGGRNDPYRGRLLFEDLLAVTAEGHSVTGGARHRIRIDETRGSVEERMLQVIETPFAPGIPPFSKARLGSSPMKIPRPW